MPDQPINEGTNGTPDQVVLGYLGDMKAVELWAKAQTKGDEEWDRPEDWDWSAMRARYVDVRQRYLTPNAAAKDFALGFGDPPLHDPDVTRVVEVTARRRDRALVVTMEALADDPDSVEMRYENRLHLIDGEWRLNTRWLNMLDGEPRIDGLV